MIRVLVEVGKNIKIVTENNWKTLPSFGSVFTNNNEQILIRGGYYGTSRNQK